MSCTVMVSEHDALLNALSLTLHVTVVTPRGNCLRGGMPVHVGFIELATLSLVFVAAMFNTVA